MIEVCNLPHGWTLLATESYEFGVTPIFRRSGGGCITWKGPDELSRSGEAYQAREIFAALKRWLDIADREWRLPGRDPRWKAADKAVLAMKVGLRQAGRWTDSLLESGVGVQVHG